MEENTLKRNKKEMGNILKSRESIFEPTDVGFTDLPSTSSSSGLTLQKKCKKLAKKFIRSLSGKNEKPNTFDVSEPLKKQTNSPAKDETRKKSWTVSKNKMSNIRKTPDERSLKHKKYGTMHTDVYQPQQRYYYIEGYGLISQMYLAEFLNFNETEKSNQLFFKSNSTVNMKNDEVKFDNSTKNNLTQTNDLKVESTHTVVKKPVPKPRTKLKRSKSVTFIDETNFDFAIDGSGEDCQTHCHCYESINHNKRTDAINEKDLVKFYYREKNKSLPKHLNKQEEEITRNNSEYANLDECRRKMIFSDRINEPRSCTYSNGNIDTEIDIDQLSIKTDFNHSSHFIKSSKKRSPSRGRNENPSPQDQISVGRTSTNDKKGLSKTETLVYRNPFYNLPSCVNSDAKNYDIKMYESKLTMDFLVDTVDSSINIPKGTRNRCMRVNMDRAETIICENHYYG